MPPSREPLTAEQHDLVQRHHHIVERALAKLSPAKKASMTEGELRAHGEDGLIAAAQKFDPEYGVPFGAFAHRHIRHAIASAVRKERGLRADLLHAARLAGDDYLAGIDPPKGGLTDPLDVIHARYDPIRAGYITTMFAAFVGAASRLATDGPEQAIDVRRTTTRAIDQLRQAISELGKRDRQLVELRYLRGLEWKDVLEEMGVKMSASAQWRFHKGVMDRLGERLRALGVEGVPDSR